MKYLQLARVLAGITVAALLGHAHAHADTDFACLSRCTSTGAQYGLCERECSFAAPTAAPTAYQAPRSTDFQCVNACTARGDMYNACVDRCSY